jgi:hypothetical protein
MLADGQLREFGSRGYLVLPSVVAERLLAPVDAEIDALVAGSPPPAGAISSYSYARPPGRLPAPTAALRESPALRLAETLVSPRTLNHDLHHIQIALSIPPDSFTMLAGIYLVDESAPDSGNLWVWPGSHLVD